MSNDPEMQLPEGKTCADCAFEKQCCAMYGAKPENTWCDFHPVKFVASNKSIIAALTKANGDLVAAGEVLVELLRHQIGEEDITGEVEIFEAFDDLETAISAARGLS